MSNYITIKVKADADQDDCLAAAEADYIAGRPELEGYDLSPRWADDDREMVALDVPVTYLFHPGDYLALYTDCGFGMSLRSVLEDREYDADAVLAAIASEGWSVVETKQGWKIEA